MSVGLTLHISYGRYTALFCNGTATIYRLYRLIYGKRAIFSSPE